MDLDQKQMKDKKDYCDIDTGIDLLMFGFIGPRDPEKISLYDAQKWLRTKGIHIAPRIYSYHDINLDEQTSWECTVYVEWSTIYVVGKSLIYEDALLLGIKEGLKILIERRNDKNNI